MIVSISYEESLELRGIAILMMLWLHCFCSWPSQEFAYISLVWLGNYPLSYRLTYIAGIVVPLYCFLSGYGLRKKYPFDMNYMKTKICRLLCQNWLVLCVFLTIGTLINPSYYDLSVESILSNFIGYNTTYNSTLWFLLPYVLLFLCSPILFKIINHKKYLFLSFGLISVLFIMANWVLKLQAQGTIRLLIISIFIANFFKILFPFTLGCIVAHYSVSNKLKDIIRQQRRTVLFILGLVLLLKLFISSYTLNSFYLIPMVVFWHLLNRPLYLKRLFVKLGRKSTWMWFIHGYFTFYIFQPYVFKLKYSFFIFMGVLVISYGLSFVFDYVYNKILSLKDIE